MRESAHKHPFILFSKKAGSALPFVARDVVFTVQMAPTFINCVS